MQSTSIPAALNEWNSFLFNFDMSPTQFENPELCCEMELEFSPNIICDCLFAIVIPYWNKSQNKNPFSMRLLIWFIFHNSTEESGVKFIGTFKGNL